MVGRLLGSKQLDRAHSLVLIAVRFVIGLQIAIALFWMASRWWIAAELAPDHATEIYLMSYMLWVPHQLCRTGCLHADGLGVQCTGYANACSLHFDSTFVYLLLTCAVAWRQPR